MKKNKFLVENFFNCIQDFFKNDEIQRNIAKYSILLFLNYIILFDFSEMKDKYIIDEKDIFSIFKYLGFKKIDVEEINNIEINIDLEKLKKIINEFKELLNNNNCKEKELENFIFDNKHYFYKFNIINKQLSTPQKNTNTQNRIDLTFNNFLNKFKDVIELKSHLFNILEYDKDHKNYYWSNETSKSISQLSKYISNLNAVNNFQDKNYENHYFSNTKGILVIGRRYDSHKCMPNLINESDKQSWEHEWNLKFDELNKLLKDINIITYDDLLVILEWHLNLLENLKI